MSDFMPQDILPDLWDEILKTHWTYLETEESIHKLENRKKLEDCLKELLCIVQPDRKFFLEETARVLKNSIQENFNVQKAIFAFECISQYANNLYTKPWRKEFRILKLYSGFYQHEIKSNLIDAEILFEAMGYRRLSEDTLILDGPICPDQVSNLSRDAMTAYVELQIMKHIHTGLDAIGINCSWLDIYRHREKHTGSTSQAIKSLANSFDEKRFCSRQKLLMGDNYGYIDVQPHSNYFAASTQFCPAECQCSSSIYQQAPSISRTRPITTRTNGVCCVPEHQTPSLTATNLVYPSQQHYQHSHQHHQPGMSTENGEVLLPHMSHSRSLDQYSEAPSLCKKILPHRHSFDHQQHTSSPCTAHNHYNNLQQQKLRQQQQQHLHYYQHLNKAQHNYFESPYDYIDGNSLGGGSSTISYAAVATNAGAATASIDSGSGSVAANYNLNPTSTYSHPYNVSGNRFPLPLNISNQLFYEKQQCNIYNDPQEPKYAHVTEQNLYSVSKLPQNFPKNSIIYNQFNTNQDLQNPLIVNDSLQRQRSCQPEQLINLNETSMQHQFDPLFHQNYETSNDLVDKHCNMRSNRESPLSLTDLSAIGQQPCGTGKPTTNDEKYVYAKPIPRENRKQNAKNSRKYSFNPGDTTDISYDSANDDLGNLPSTDSERNHQSSPTQSIKNQDGVGSVELWSNVYQNVEKKAYSKDVGDRNDIRVQSLDLDSMSINDDTSVSQNSSTDKKISLHSGNENKTAVQHQKQQKPEPKYRTKMQSNNTQKQKSSLDKNKKVPKQTNSTLKPNNTGINKSQTKANDNKSLSKIENNNNNDLPVNSGNGSKQHKKLSSSAVNATGKTLPGASTQIIITSANEWSCSFCTFLNPESKRVCEMCCHSKDFKTDSTSSKTGGTTTMAHNTPTCA